MKSMCLLALSLLFAVCAASAPVDGPYVLRGTEGSESWSVEQRDGGLHKVVQPIAAGAKFAVPAVGSLPAFDVTLRKPATLAPEAITAAATVPLFVVADTHGEYEILAQMLQSHRVVDARLRWSFGRGHLIILGDVFDRGAHQTEILWLLYELEAQARKAGGGVHLLLGNHETMAMRGDLRYLHPKYVQTATTLGVSSYSQLFDSRSVLGQWLRTRPAVFKINDLLCLHGGISPALVERKLSVADINATIRGVLADTPLQAAAEQERAEFVMGSTGPLWYRGYFPERANATPAASRDIDLALAHFGVHRILVGHTIVPTITSLYDGKVIAVQVYPGHEQSGSTHFEALLIKRGKLFHAMPDGSTRELAAP